MAQKCNFTTIYQNLTTVACVWLQWTECLQLSTTLAHGSQRFVSHAERVGGFGMCSLCNVQPDYRVLILSRQGTRATMAGPLPGLTRYHHGTFVFQREREREAL